MADTRNPVLVKMEAQAKTGYPAGSTTTAAPDAPAGPPVGFDQYSVPVGTAPAGVARMSIADVIVKTGAMFLILIAFATVSWRLDLPPGVYLVALFAAVGVGIWASVRREVSPGLYLLYAALEGVVVGWISKLYNQWAIDNGNQQGIVGWAILGTLVTFAVMLVLYRAKFVRASGRFVRMMMIGMISYLVLSLISLVTAMFGVGNGFGFYGLGAIGIGLCMIGVALAASCLVLDFAAIEQMITAGAPERESWRAAFGLVVTLVWLYLELLRLFALLSSNR
jgi:uncharacterized YccA/Bax inhibitor family protein